MIGEHPDKTFYAVEAVLYIAYNAASGAISSRDIAEKQGLPPRYLEVLMQRLVKERILRGIRGPKGGYVLAKERRRITVADVCMALSTPDDDKEAAHYAGTPLGKTLVMPLWKQAYGAWLSTLMKINLAELCEEAAKRNLKKHISEKMDFTI